MDPCLYKVKYTISYSCAKFAFIQLLHTTMAWHAVRICKIS